MGFLRGACRPAAQRCHQILSARLLGEKPGLFEHQLLGTGPEAVQQPKFDKQISSRQSWTASNYPGRIIMAEIHIRGL